MCESQFVNLSMMAFNRFTEGVYFLWSGDYIVKFMIKLWNQHLNYSTMWQVGEIPQSNH